MSTLLKYSHIWTKKEDFLAELLLEVQQRHLSKIEEAMILPSFCLRSQLHLVEERAEDDPAELLLMDQQQLLAQEREEDDPVRFLLEVQQHLGGILQVGLP